MSGASLNGVSLAWPQTAPASPRGASGADTGILPAEAFAAAWAGWIRAAGSAKEVARLFQASPRTVEGWREGAPPLVRHLVTAVGLWGRPFVDEVFGALLAADEADLFRRLERVRIDMLVLLQAAEELRDAEAAGGDGGSDDAVACPRVAVARRSRLGLARPARALVAALVLVGLSCSLAGGQDQVARLVRGRGRPVAARMVGTGAGAAGNWGMGS